MVNRPIAFLSTLYHNRDAINVRLSFFYLQSTHPNGERDNPGKTNTKGIIAQGASICHLEVGQPVQAAPPQVLEAAKNALVDDRLGYTSALGISELRASIAESYGRYPDVGGKGTGERERPCICP